MVAGPRSVNQLLPSVGHAGCDKISGRPAKPRAAAGAVCRLRLSAAAPGKLAAPARPPAPSGGSRWPEKLESTASGRAGCRGEDSAEGVFVEGYAIVGGG